MYLNVTHNDDDNNNNNKSNSPTGSKGCVFHNLLIATLNWVFSFVRFVSLRSELLNILIPE